MKVIFLDVDGVLNSMRSFCVAPKPAEYRCFEDWVYESIDPIAVALIDRLITENECKLVISSSHRQTFFTGKTEPMELGDEQVWPRWEHRLDEMRAYFGKMGLKNTDAIISCTPDIVNTIRGGEIQAWLERHPEVTHYAIIDDDSDMTDEQKESHFAHTSTNDGFSFDNFRQVEVMLGKVEKPKIKLY